MVGIGWRGTCAGQRWAHSRLCGAGLIRPIQPRCRRSFGLDENEALVAANRAVGFPVGHASAQLGWRGVLSRPTWKMLVYSAEDPPAHRGLVLVDAVDGTIVEYYVEENPEEWTQSSEVGGASETNLDA